MFDKGNLEVKFMPNEQISKGITQKVLIWISNVFLSTDDQNRCKTDVQSTD